MNYFSSDRLVLRSDSARALYSGCKNLPVFDYHNHLSPQLLYENRNFGNMAEFWLSGDHYIWRAMRLAGVEERFITVRYISNRRSRRTAAGADRPERRSRRRSC